MGSALSSVSLLTDHCKRSSRSRKLINVRRLNTSAHPAFTVVANPHSGPGSINGPGKDYVAAIEQLKSASKVQTIGYVRTGYATRNISSVLEDVAIYSRWPQIADSLAVNGIFFDEAPSEYTSEAVDYMKRINRAVKDASGILEPKMVRRSRR